MPPQSAGEKHGLVDFPIPHRQKPPPALRTDSVTCSGLTPRVGTGFQVMFSVVFWDGKGTLDSKDHPAGTPVGPEMTAGQASGWPEGQAMGMELGELG